MMGGVSPETCWAIKKHWNNKFYHMVASCWFFLLDLYYDARIHKYQVEVRVWSEASVCGIYKKLFWRTSLYPCRYQVTSAPYTLLPLLLTLCNLSAGPSGRVV
jgi:hypothetical protein